MVAHCHLKMAYIFGAGSGIHEAFISDAVEEDVPRTRTTHQTVWMFAGEPHKKVEVLPSVRIPSFGPHAPLSAIKRPCGVSDFSHCPISSYSNISQEERDDDLSKQASKQAGDLCGPSPFGHTCPVGRVQSSTQSDAVGSSDSSLQLPPQRFHVARALTFGMQKALKLVISYLKKLRAVAQKTTGRTQVEELKQSQKRLFHGIPAAQMLDSSAGLDVTACKDMPKHQKIGTESKTINDRTKRIVHRGT
ncbi:hypothetical protein OPV22_032806 [Ensete ventricosum]|uniref:DUF4005 domain-containing protein n=1 Tax=Ensete ventricosum TaxID=4639 RepID=A0AAV8P1L4_ENSVE|nr:hypothetical protein OPV22_032806 [Ensete ventricosum]